MPSKQGYALLEQHFPKGALAPTTVLMTLKGKVPPTVIEHEIPARLRRCPGVAAAFSTGRSSDGGKLARLSR